MIKMHMSPWNKGSTTCRVYLWGSPARCRQLPEHQYDASYSDEGDHTSLSFKNSQREQSNQALGLFELPWRYPANCREALLRAK